MAIEGIRRNEYADADRMEVQERVARAVEKDPDAFLKAYAAHPDSMGGRYVCADLMKETFAAYAQSPESRNRYNSVVHNAAAVLAAEQYRRMLADDDKGRRTGEAILLTGSPGSGKTTAINGPEMASLRNSARVIYEGQLSDTDVARKKIDEALGQGVRPVVVAIHAKPENSLENTFDRFDRIGRGASIGTMARIQGDMAYSLRQMGLEYGDKASLVILRRDANAVTQRADGWHQVPLLQSEGNREQIEQRLRDRLDAHRAGGTITEACYRQARGLAPESEHERRHRHDGFRTQPGGDGLTVSREDRRADHVIALALRQARYADTPAELAQAHFAMRTSITAERYAQQFGPAVDRRSHALATAHGQTLAKAFRDLEPQKAVKQHPELRPAYAYMQAALNYADKLGVEGSKKAAYVDGVAKQITQRFEDGRQVKSPMPAFAPPERGRQTPAPDRTGPER